MSWWTGKVEAEPWEPVTYISSLKKHTIIQQSFRVTQPWEEEEEEEREEGKEEEEEEEREEQEEPEEAQEINSTKLQWKATEGSLDANRWLGVGRWPKWRLGSHRQRPSIDSCCSMVHRPNMTLLDDQRTGTGLSAPPQHTRNVSASSVSEEVFYPPCEEPPQVWGKVASGADLQSLVFHNFH